MKSFKNELFKHLHYLCLAGVIALGLMTIVATSHNGDNGTVAPGGGAGGGAAPLSGTFDNTFGVGGVVVDDDAAGGNSNDQGNTITPGSFFVTGWSINANVPPDRDIVVWKYNDDGTLDGTFGTGGIFVFDGGGGVGITGGDRAFSHAVDAMGRIVVTGTSPNAAGGEDMVVLRLLPNGTLDTMNFNAAGAVPGVFRFNRAGGISAFDSGNGIAIDANGNIVVTGTSPPPPLPPFDPGDMVIWRLLTTTGVLDPAFGGGAGFIVHNNAAGGNGFDLGASIAINATTGNIVVTGQSFNGANNDMVVWRFLPTGALDVTFGGGTGFFVHNNAAGGNGFDAGFNVKIAPNGKIDVTGQSTNAKAVPGPDPDMVVWRLLPTGALDTMTLNAPNGFVVFDGGNGFDAGNSMMQNPFLVAGIITNAAGDADMAVWKLNDDGTLDGTFNMAGATPGVLTFDSGNGADIGTSVTTAPNNKILVTGSATNAAGDTDQATWRIQ